MTLRADLHVHTCYSKSNTDIAFLRSRDCYSRPLDVYRTAKARGMDLVAITDHDTIDGALDLLDQLRDTADVIVGEEVTCWLPVSSWSGRAAAPIEVHLGVYGMTESLHRDLQPLRRNVFEAAARLRAAGVLFSLNHLLHFYDRRISFEEYLMLLAEVPAVEVRNGTMLPAHNALVEALVADRSAIRGGAPLAVVAGSDAHTLRRVGRTWTEAPGDDRDAFLDNVRRGLGRPGGAHGSVFAVAGDAYGVIRSYVASLAGIGIQDHAIAYRALFLTFSVLSLPFEFLPFAIALARKSREARQVRFARRFLAPSQGLEQGSPVVELMHD